MKPHQHKPICEPGESEPHAVVGHVFCALVVAIAIAFVVWWLYQ